MDEVAGASFVEDLDLTPVIGYISSHNFFRFIELNVSEDGDGIDIVAKIRQSSHLVETLLLTGGQV